MVFLLSTDAFLEEKPNNVPASEHVASDPFVRDLDVSDHAAFGPASEPASSKSDDTPSVQNPKFGLASEPETLNSDAASRALEEPDGNPEFFFICIPNCWF